MKGNVIALEIQYMYGKEKVVKLPVPYISKSGEVGEVVCNPIGRFPVEDGRKLLGYSGPDGPFKLVREVYEDVEEHKPTIPEIVKALEAQSQPPPEVSVPHEIKHVEEKKKRGNPNWHKKNKVAVPDDPEAY